MRVNCTTDCCFIKKQEKTLKIYNLKYYNLMLVLIWLVELVIDNESAQNVENKVALVL